MRHLSAASSSASGCPITGTSSSSSVPPSSSSSSSSSTNQTRVQLREVPTLPYLGSVIHQHSGIPPLNPAKFLDFYTEMRRRFGDFYKIGLPGIGKGRDGITYVLLTDPAEMQKVLRQERGRGPPPYPRGVFESDWPLAHWLRERGSILGKGPKKSYADDCDDHDKLGYAGRGETWKRLRTFLQTDLLSPAAAAGYVPIMAEAARLASRGAPASAGDPNGYAHRCSFDLFNSLMFGQLTRLADPETGRDQEENLLFCNTTVRGMDTLFRQMTDPMQKVLFDIGITTGLYKDMSSSFDTAFGIAKKKYHAFRERSDADQLTEAEKSSYLQRAILRQKEEGEKVSEEEMIELINVGLVAAVDTTSSMLSWNMLQLALNPEVQEKLHAELAETVRNHGALRSESLRKKHVPYLHAILRETHRITPSTPTSVMKENSLSDIEIHGSIVPKDSLFLMDSYSVGMDSAIVDEPNAYRPERWLPREVEARKGTPGEIVDHPFYRDAFSQGSRKCPGSRVANNEVLIMVSQLVLDWKIAAPGGYGKEDVTARFSGMLHPILPELEFVARQV